jgi:uncharacterized protein YbjT (DUF2867 family)
MGLAVRAVSRNRPADLGDRIEWRAADASDPTAAADAANGATTLTTALAATVDWYRNRTAPPPGHRRDPNHDQHRRPDRPIP